MRYSILGLILFSAVVSAVQLPFERWQWQHRIIVIGQSQPQILAQLQANQDAIEERDILWFYVPHDTVITNLAGTFEGKETDQISHYAKQMDEVAILIGKDGGIKVRQQHWDLAMLLAQIDRMPMRQAEKQR